MPILLSHRNQPALHLNQTRFSSEAALQAYIQTLSASLQPFKTP